jgi:hypothetical protein
VIDAVTLHLEYFRNEVLAVKVDFVQKALEESELVIEKQVLV